MKPATTKRPRPTTEIAQKWNEQPALDERQAGRYIGASDDALRYWRKKKPWIAPPYYTLGDKLIRYRRRDLDAWIDGCNRNRPHQSRRCFGKTPTQTFLDTIPLAKEKLMAAGSRQARSSHQTLGTVCQMKS